MGRLQLVQNEIILTKAFIPSLIQKLINFPEDKTPEATFLIERITEFYMQRCVSEQMPTLSDQRDSAHIPHVLWLFKYLDKTKDPEAEHVRELVIILVKIKMVVDTLYKYYTQLDTLHTPPTDHHEQRENSESVTNNNAVQREMDPLRRELMKLAGRLVDAIEKIQL